MRRFLLLFLIILGGYTAFAQIEVKPDSFKKVEGFVNIDLDRMYDDNQEPYAVLKIRTENINNKQRRAFRFSVDSNISYEIVYKTGEIWLYVSHYLKNLTITSTEFNTINYTIPFDMQPKCGYEMTIVNKAEPVEMGFAFVDITSKPVTGATIFIDGQMVNKKTPYSIELPPGKHDITVAKDLYDVVTKTVVLKADEDLRLEIVMPLGTGAQLTLKADNETSVYIDGEFKGKGTWTGIVKEGQYNVVGKKPNHHDATQTIILVGKDQKTFELTPMPKSKDKPKSKPGKTSGGSGRSKYTMDGYQNRSLSVDYAFDKNNTNSFGLTYVGGIDQILNMGFYLTVYGNWFAKGKYSDFTCDKDKLVDGVEPTYKDGQQAHNFTILGGFSYFHNKPFNMRIGIGYQRKWVAYELDLTSDNLPAGYDESNPYVRNEALTYKGFAMDLGVSYFIGRSWGVNLSFDVVTCKFKTVDYKFGIGLAF